MHLVTKSLPFACVCSNDKLHNYRKSLININKTYAYKKCK